MASDSCERDPLLTGANPHVRETLKQNKQDRPRSIWPSFHTVSPKYRWVPLLGCAIIFMNEAEYFVKQVATMRAIEAMYCYEFYLDRNSPLAELGKHIPEKMCKDQSIQKNIARTAGLIMFVRVLSAIVGALPLGWVADRLSRKIVLVMHKVNVTISCTIWLALYLEFPKIPIWALYISGSPGLFGGNFDVGLAMLFASYTDVMPSATERASLFFLPTSMQYLAQAFCPTIGAWLMNLDGKGGTLQVNLAVSLCLSLLTVLITVFVWRETVHESRKENARSSLVVNEFQEGTSKPNPKEGKNRTYLFSRVRGWCNTFEENVSSVGVFNVVCLALSISFAASGIKAIDWYALIQFPVIKLHWTFPQASFIVSVQGILMLLHFSLFLPYFNRTIAAWLDSVGHAHFVIMAGSSALLAVGSLVIGFSYTSTMFVGGTIIYLLGEGLPTATQAYIVSLVEKDRVARVMATLSMTSILGKLFASLLFPKLLAWGIDTHIELLIGLPLFVGAGLFMLSAACFSVVGMRMWNEHGPSRESEDENA